MSASLTLSFQLLGLGPSSTACSDHKKTSDKKNFNYIFSYTDYTIANLFYDVLYVRLKYTRKGCSFFTFYFFTFEIKLPRKVDLFYAKTNAVYTKTCMDETHHFRK
jgi:hypothetical protein